jgi:hypothetical protein
MVFVSLICTVNGSLAAADSTVSLKTATNVFYYKAKKVRKTLTSTFCDFFLPSFPLKNSVKVPSKSNIQKFFF